MNILRNILSAVLTAVVGIPVIILAVPLAFFYMIHYSAVKFAKEALK